MAIEPTRRSMLGAAAVAALGSLAALAGAQPQVRTIAIVARKFEFEPRTIRLKKGEPVLLALSAPDVAMGFNVGAFGVRADIAPGRPTLLALTPDRAGEFVFYCDVFCGSGHEEMDGVLSVTE